MRGREVRRAGCGCSGRLTTGENPTKEVGGVAAPARPRLMERENRFALSEMRQESRCPLYNGAGWGK